MTYHPYSRALNETPPRAKSIKDPQKRIDYLRGQKQHYQSVGNTPDLQEVLTLIDNLIKDAERDLNFNFSNQDSGAFLNYCKNNSIEQSQIYTFVSKIDKDGFEYLFNDLSKCGNGLLFEVLTDRFGDYETKEYIKYSVKGFLESRISDIVDQSKIDDVRNVISSNDINGKFEILNKFLVNQKYILIDDFANISEVYNIAMKKYSTFEEPKQTENKPKQQPSDITDEERKAIIDKPKKYKYNRENPDYLHDYLSEIRASFVLSEKVVFGAVCLVLYDKKIFNAQINFKTLVELLSAYWNIEPPKDKHPNKYTDKKNELIFKYEILGRKII